MHRVPATTATFSPVSQPAVQEVLLFGVRSLPVSQSILNEEIIFNEIQLKTRGSIYFNEFT
jgi:hypothetical protein